MDAPIIQARGLSKRFKARKGSAEVVAVADLTTDIAPGSLTAFLGPNGAGKSTSLRMLTTLLEPSGGTATVCGYDVATQAPLVRASIGYVGQKNGAGHYQRIRDELVSQGALYGLGPAERRRRATELIEMLDLGEVADRNAITLSGGQRRRADVALGLIPGPSLLFLDEPSTGLDPQSRAHLWEHILTLRARYGMTIFLTTHYLEEADQLAERVMIVDQGRIIADGTASRLKADLAGDRVTVLVAADPDGAARVLRAASARSGVTEPDLTVGQTPEGTRFVATVQHGDRVLPGLLRDLAPHDVRAAELARPSLDDVFLTLTGRSLREENQTQTTPEPQGAPR
ncbi:ATP-binding cassette domain-containing protein [Georgenia sp. TF02-10]|uniref:ABC transporter ATP-binding protein n=1 Tax=Georgenia sp. TF02-10 TaxID=2917725 RepID=UPI001FA75B25|nr:ATP-binding cassette domain-containing protein [Georgenia sp. TF02-10]UNX55134.1 ATP-binding cassette domain-containing protein [Georgenia sp. TF02-10]